MLALGIFFVAWTLISPPEVFHGHEMSEDDLPEQLRHTGLEADLPEDGGPRTPGRPGAADRPRTDRLSPTSRPVARSGTRAREVS